MAGGSIRKGPVVIPANGKIGFTFRRVALPDVTDSWCRGPSSMNSTLRLRSKPAGEAARKLTRTPQAMKKFFPLISLSSSRSASFSRNFPAVKLEMTNPTGPSGEYNGSITTGGSYDPYTGNAKRFVDDLTVTGSIGAYPLKMDAGA